MKNSTNPTRESRYSAIGRILTGKAHPSPLESYFADALIEDGNTFTLFLNGGPYLTHNLRFYSHPQDNAILMYVAFHIDHSWIFNQIFGPEFVDSANVESAIIGQQSGRRFHLLAVDPSRARELLRMISFIISALKPGVISYEHENIGEHSYVDYSTDWSASPMPLPKMNFPRLAFPIRFEVQK